jgi:hypothetical protein
LVAVPRVADASVFAAVEHPVIFAESKLEGYDYFTGSFNVDDKASKVTFAPFLMSGTYRDGLSETRFQLSQKDKSPSLGIGIRYNPTSPRGARGKALWCRMIAKLPRSPFFELRLLQGREREFAVLRDQAGTEVRQLDSLRSRDPDPTRRMQLADSILVLRSRVADAEQKLVTERKKVLAADSAWHRAKDKFFEEYRDSLLAYRGPIPSLNASFSYFPTLASSRLDKDADQLDDNHYSARAQSLALGLDWRFQRWWQLSAIGAIGGERTGAEEGSPYSKTGGVGLTLGRILSEINPEFRKTDEFKKSLFVPAITAGAGAEYQWCVVEPEECKDGIVGRFAVTPFLDFKIRKEAQFRVGFTWERVKKDQDESAINNGLLSTLAFQLGF